MVSGRCVSTPGRVRGIRVDHSEEDLGYRSEYKEDGGYIPLLTLSAASTNSFKITRFFAFQYSSS